ncbi:DNA adenine methylase [Micromonospora inyonensis]|uniref:site-specific DNA-methyltransferase (adenine-specific) n=1 Tax=Micromonospora inyonensis TaxID=47866 RepID=A0A1C6R758_9ACTN|nr:DNA adenine methylase [Micromonospora inyonensis]SCL12841.1 DNA adenine methylase [Micromonospora inyonensis]
MTVEMTPPALTALTDEDLRLLGGGPAEEEAPLLSGEHVRLRRASLSPLRYPGSKRKMLPAIRQLIVDNVPRPELLVEPFCGGASVSLGLLEADAVERVLLADFDPLVAAFWQVAAEDTDALVKAMRKEPVTVENWDRWRKYRPRTPLNRAMKCLFLNRTTFSGIIGSDAGPIGGRAQTNYSIDCRFDKDAIEARLRNIQLLRKQGRIVGTVAGRWQSTFRYAHDVAASLDLKADSVVFYLDPPYIEKASDLYERPFTEQDHIALAQHLDSTERWVLSYDKEPLVLSLYRGMQGVRQYRVTHHYTMTGSRKSPVPGREVLFTNLPQPPHQSALPPSAPPRGDI